MSAACDTSKKPSPLAVADASAAAPPLDPKQIYGSMKTPLHLIPPCAKAAQARVHAMGALKYGEWNWRHHDVSITTYLSAMMRHIDAVMSGQDDDPESGEHHLAHVAAGCNIVLDAARAGRLVDDRPPIS